CEKGHVRLLLAPELSAHNRAEQEIVKFNGQSIEAEERTHLGPVTDLMQQNVSHNFSRRRREKPIEQFELLRRVPFLSWKALDKISQIPAALPAELKQRFNVAGGDLVGIGYGPARQPVHVSLLRREDVPHHIAGFIKPAITMSSRSDLQSRSVLP